ncbi:Uncharacterized protein TCAP_00520 [Tolypocladium capitatum]|uniref:Uncharacterized protein n=1 Tax=Tolypocladium capitatum TaxID=45235 RepID=A0A2K3QPV7_9HYPO|nr:Uncharacterized protein TCAP_00520 [Tolypocladium capitatum]
MTSNFNLPIDFSRLQNDRLKLAPLEDNLEEWADAYVQDANRNPHVYDWLTYGPFANATEYVSWYNENSRNDTSEILLAILLKAGTVVYKDPVTGETTTTEVADGTFAGLCGLVSQPERATVDIGQLLVGRFQRTWRRGGRVRAEEGAVASEREQCGERECGEEARVSVGGTDQVAAGAADGKDRERGGRTGEGGVAEGGVGWKRMGAREAYCHVEFVLGGLGSRWKGACGCAC